LKTHIQNMNHLNPFIAVLLALIFSLPANAGTDTDGGPRTVIQAKTEIVVEQPTPTNLNTKIVDSVGNAVIELDTEEACTVISVAGLRAGIYTVETIDDHGNYQGFEIRVQ